MRNNQWKVILDRLKADCKVYYPAVILFVLYNIIVRSIFHAFCPFLTTFGFPCAGCGMTRAIYHILTGNFKRGMALNPAAPFWILFIVYFFLNRYIIGKQRKNMFACMGIVCGITIIIYFYRMLTSFPGDPPLVYYSNNIMKKVLLLH